MARFLPGSGHSSAAAPCCAEPLTKLSASLLGLAVLLVLSGPRAPGNASLSFVSGAKPKSEETTMRTSIRLSLLAASLPSPLA